jgi:RNA polymerase sigma-70 factor (ECF subfamily)
MPIQPQDGRDLVERFRSGDRDAFTALYRAHQAAVFRFAFHMTSDRAKASEITQDVFVWLIHHAGEFDPARGELGAFLVGVTRKFLQRKRSDERRFVPFEEMAEKAAQPDPGASRRESQSIELRKAIQALPVGYRETVVLCDLEGKSYEEAAGLLECAIGTVRSRLHRARALLARKLRGTNRQEGGKDGLKQRCAV